MSIDGQSKAKIFSRGEIGSVLRALFFDGFSFAYAGLFFFLLFARPDADLLLASLNAYVAGFAAAMAFGAALSFGLRLWSVRTLGEVIYAPPHRRHRATNASSGDARFWRFQTLALVLVTVVAGVIITDFSPLRLVESDAIVAAMRLFRELLNPDLSILPKAVLKIIESIFIAFMATALAAPASFVLSFLAARNIMGKTRSGMLFLTVLRFLFNLTRSVEPVLWAIIFSVWVSFGPFAGMLALAVHSVASLSKQYSEIVESIESGPIEGIESTGAGPLQTVWFAVVPQVVLPYISYTIDRWDINVRMATILGFVGGGGIGTMLMEYQGQSRWPQVGCIIMVIAAVVWTMDAFSAHVRSAIK